MAYLTYLISLSDEEVKQHINKIDRLEKLGFGVLYFIYKVKPDNFFAITHYYCSYGTGINELDELVYRAIDRGKFLHKRYWHPFRVPVTMDSLEVHKISEELEEGKKIIGEKYEFEYLKSEFESLQLFYKNASRKNHAVISFLGKPYDFGRAIKTIYPVKFKTRKKRIKH